MWRRARAAAALVAVMGAVLLLGAAPVAAAPELGLSPASGPPGSRFLVTGTGFAPAEVVIRWGDESGPELGRAFGPDFALEVGVPEDAPPSSHPVMAVVADGGPLSTSSAPFQVTGSEPVDTPTSSTTVPDATVDTAPPPRSGASPPSAQSGGLSRADSVGGGVDGGMADTTNGGGEAGADAAGARGGGTAGSTAAGGAAADAGSTTTTAPPGAGATGPEGAGAVLPVTGAGAAVPGGRDDATAPRLDAGEASGSALAPRPANQSAGGRDPVLLVAGLGMVLAAGVVLAVRLRRRAITPPGSSGR